MSLILEALRKSEAERRRGQVPNLHAERAPAALPARTARPAWPWLALAILAVLATAWVARGVWSPPPRAVDPSPDPVGRSVPTPAAIDESSARDADVGNRAAAVAMPLGAPGPASTAPSSRASDTAATATSESAARPPPRATADATPTRKGSAAVANIATPTPPAAVETLPRPIPAPTPAIAAAVTPPTPAPTSTAVAAPLRLSDLSAAERLELPPLKISMHMWDPTPARRFAIIDGARVNEGDRLGEAVVDEITASAVVLAWRGQQLQIPLR